MPIGEGTGSSGNLMVGGKGRRSYRQARQKVRSAQLRRRIGGRRRSPYRYSIVFVVRTGAVSRPNHHDAIRSGSTVRH